MQLLRTISACFILAALAVTGGCVSTGKSIKGGERIVAEGPEMRVGDSWTHEGYSASKGTNVYHQTVIEVAEDGSYVLEEKFKTGEVYTLYYNNEYQRIKIVDKKTGKDLTVRNPPARFLKFPMKIGSTWSDSYLETSRGGLKTGYKNEFTVTDYQEIEVNGKMYQAFAIKRKHMPQSGSWVRYESMWYCPAVKSMVLTKPDWRKGYKLLSFTPGP